MFIFKIKGFRPNLKSEVKSGAKPSHPKTRYKIRGSWLRG